MASQSLRIYAPVQVPSPDAISVDRRTIIFDLDGTLVDSCVICIDILNGILADRQSSHTIDHSFARKFMSRGGADMVSALLGPARGDPEQDLALFRERYQQTFTDSEALFPGVADGLAELRAAGFTMAICSNKPQNLCEKVLDDTGLAPIFDVVVGGRPGLQPKPHSDLLLTTLAALECEVDDCIFVGDSELDHAVAQSANMPFKFLRYGYADEGWCHDPSESYDCFRTMSHAIMAGTLPRNA